MGPSGAGTSAACGAARLECSPREASGPLAVLADARVAKPGSAPPSEGSKPSGRPNKRSSRPAQPDPLRRAFPVHYKGAGGYLRLAPLDRDNLLAALSTGPSSSSTAAAAAAAVEALSRTSAAAGPAKKAPSLSTSGMSAAAGPITAEPLRPELLAEDVWHAELTATKGARSGRRTLQLQLNAVLAVWRHEARLEGLRTLLRNWCLSNGEELLLTLRPDGRLVLSRPTPPPTGAAAAGAALPEFEANGSGGSGSGAAGDTRATVPAAEAEVHLCRRRGPVLQLPQAAVAWHFADLTEATWRDAKPVDGIWAAVASAAEARAAGLLQLPPDAGKAGGGSETQVSSDRVPELVELRCVRLCRPKRCGANLVLEGLRDLLRCWGVPEGGLVQLKPGDRGGNCAGARRLVLEPVRTGQLGAEGAAHGPGSTAWPARARAASCGADDAGTGSGGGTAAGSVGDSDVAGGDADADAAQDSGADAAGASKDTAGPTGDVAAAVNGGFDARGADAAAADAAEPPLPAEAQQQQATTAAADPPGSDTRPLQSVQPEVQDEDRREQHAPPVREREQEAKATETAAEGRPPPPRPPLQPPLLQLRSSPPPLGMGPLPGAGRPLPLPAEAPPAEAAMPEGQRPVLPLFPEDTSQRAEPPAGEQLRLLPANEPQSAEDSAMAVAAEGSGGRAPGAAGGCSAAGPVGLVASHRSRHSAEVEQAMREEVLSAEADDAAMRAKVAAVLASGTAAAAVAEGQAPQTRRAMTPAGGAIATLATGAAVAAALPPTAGLMAGPPGAAAREKLVTVKMEVEEDVLAESVPLGPMDATIAGRNASPRQQTPPEAVAEHAVEEEGEAAPMMPQPELAEHAVEVEEEAAPMMPQPELAEHAVEEEEEEAPMMPQPELAEHAVEEEEEAAPMMPQPEPAQAEALPKPSPRQPAPAPAELPTGQVAWEAPLPNIMQTPTSPGAPALSPVGLQPPLEPLQLLAAAAAAEATQLPLAGAQAWRGMAATVAAQPPPVPSASAQQATGPACPPRGRGSGGAVKRRRTAGTLTDFDIADSADGDDDDGSWERCGAHRAAGAEDGDGGGGHGLPHSRSGRPIKLSRVARELRLDDLRGARGQQARRHYQRLPKAQREAAREAYELQAGLPIVAKYLPQGYRWRKYGEKVVEGTVRSYFRCSTCSCCPVKLKAEWMQLDSSSTSGGGDTGAGGSGGAGASGGGEASGAAGSGVRGTIALPAAPARALRFWVQGEHNHPPQPQPQDDPLGPPLLVEQPLPPPARPARRSEPPLGDGPGPPVTRYIMLLVPVDDDPPEPGPQQQQREREGDARPQEQQQQEGLRAGRAQQPQAHGGAGAAIASSDGSGGDGGMPDGGGGGGGGGATLCGGDGDAMLHFDGKPWAADSGNAVVDTDPDVPARMDVGGDAMHGGCGSGIALGGSDVVMADGTGDAATTGGGGDAMAGGNAAWHLGVDLDLDTYIGGDLDLDEALDLNYEDLDLRANGHIDSSMGGYDASAARHEGHVYGDMGGLYDTAVHVQPESYAVGRFAAGAASAHHHNHHEGVDCDLRPPERAQGQDWVGAQVWMAPELLACCPSIGAGSLGAEEPHGANGDGDVGRNVGRADSSYSGDCRASSSHGWAEGGHASSIGADGNWCGSSGVAGPCLLGLGPLGRSFEGLLHCPGEGDEGEEEEKLDAIVEIVAAAGARSWPQPAPAEMAGGSAAAAVMEEGGFLPLHCPLLPALGAGFQTDVTAE